MKGKKRRRNGH